MAAATLTELHAGKPSVLAFVWRAMQPRRLPRDGSFPAIVERWTPLHMQASDMPAILQPHVFGFPLQMALLTHPAYPLSILNALQVRNRLVLYRPLDLAGPVDLETRVAAHGVLEKGIEVDLASRLSQGGDCRWESLVTYFYRGRYGPRTDSATAPVAPALANATEVHRLRTPRDGAWTFARWTGDYNPIHLFTPYARRFGFRAALLHPQRVAALALARLPAPASEAQVLELWIKGPVFYGASIGLRAEQEPGCVRFGILVEDEARPAISGEWRPGPASPRPAT